MAAKLEVSMIITCGTIILVTMALGYVYGRWRDDANLFGIPPAVILGGVSCAAAGALHFAMPTISSVLVAVAAGCLVLLSLEVSLGWGRKHSGKLFIIPAPVVAEFDMRSGSPESIALRSFLRPADQGGSLTDGQAMALFGVYSTENGLIKPGIFTEAQVKVLIHVARCDMPTERLDELMPGGSLEISTEQIEKLRLGDEHGLTEVQYAALVSVFQMRPNAKAA